jgi:hypothetical protein
VHTPFFTYIFVFYKKWRRPNDCLKTIIKAIEKAGLDKQVENFERNTTLVRDKLTFPPISEVRTVQYPFRQSRYNLQEEKDDR